MLANICFRLSGRMEVFLEDFEIEAMVNDVASTAMSLVQKNSNELRIQVEAKIGSMRADLTKVRQMLFNLISNAAKFTSEGQISLDVSTFDRNATPMVRMNVTDTGIGPRGQA